MPFSVKQKRKRCLLLQARNHMDLRTIFCFIKLPLNIPSGLSYSSCNSYIVEKTVTHGKLNISMVTRWPIDQ